MRKVFTAWTVIFWLVSAVAAGAQPAAPASPPPSSEAPLTFKVLVDQIQGLFPVIKTEVIEVTDSRIILASGRADGMQTGVELATFREGRELYHPTTKKLLGRTEETLGRIVVAEVFVAR